MTPERDDDALYDGRGELPEDLARLYAAASRLPLPAEPDWSRVQQAPRRMPRAAWLAVAAAFTVVLAAGALVRDAWHRDAWHVETIAGRPRLRGFAFGARMAVGGALVTDGASEARLLVPGLGEVLLAPGSVLRRVPGRRGERRLALDHGTLHASITAPPRLFVVETPVGVATDLGCAYKLSVAVNGDGRLTVTHGRVVFADRGRESFVPAGVSCALSAAGVGLPRRDYATDAFLAALTSYEQPDCAATALDTVLATAEASDAITLWHMLPRVAGAERERVAERLAALIEVPATVPRTGVLALEPAALDAWWSAIGMGSASEWRAGVRKKGLLP